MGFWDRLLSPTADKMLAAQSESGYRTYYPTTGEMASYDWCRFRGDRRCYMPIGHETNPDNYYGPGTEPTVAVPPPADRGYCPFEKWDAQRTCRYSEPGPNSNDPDAGPLCVVPPAERTHDGNRVPVPWAR